MSDISEVYRPIRMIAVDLLDEIVAEGEDALRGIGEMEHHDAQGDALIEFGDGHDPKMVARLLMITIADRLGEAAA